MNAHDLKARLGRIVLGRDVTTALDVDVMSFGFKHGVPLDADLMFDVRFLPNPHYDPVLRPQTGPRRARRGVRVRAAGDGARGRRDPGPARALDPAPRGRRQGAPDGRHRLHRGPASLGRHRRTARSAAGRALRGRRRGPPRPGEEPVASRAPMVDLASRRPSGIRARREALLDRIHERGERSVAELAAALRVSAATVRRDLSALERQGLVDRTWGGARAHVALRYREDFERRAGRRQGGQARGRACGRRTDRAERGGRPLGGHHRHAARADAARPAGERRDERDQRRRRALRRARHQGDRQRRRAQGELLRTGRRRRRRDHPRLPLRRLRLLLLRRRRRRLLPSRPRRGGGRAHVLRCRRRAACCCWTGASWAGRTGPGWPASTRSTT